MNNRVFFIVGCGRSGTTSLTRILDTASNAEVFVEQEPKLCIDSRIKYQFGMNLSDEYIMKSKKDAIRNTHKNNLVYGDKNPNFLFFIDELIANFDSKFVFVFRDGRDVVRSMMDWDAHGKVHYGRFEDDTSSHVTQPEENFWDFARLRPREGEAFYADWRSLSKFEKLSWYWNKYNELLLDKMQGLDKNRYIKVNMTGIDADAVKKIFDFLGLEEFDEGIVATLLTSRINSIKENWNTQDMFPKWKEWDTFLRSRFDRFARPMMTTLGYYTK